MSTNEESFSRDAVVRGKYARLYENFRQLGGMPWHASFGDVEDVLGFSLPLSARDHRPWWSNQRDGSHSHARAWLAAGYKTEDVNMEAQTVTFRYTGNDTAESKVAVKSLMPLDLDKDLPPHNGGTLREGVRLRRADMYRE